MSDARDDPIAVTGVGLVTALGTGADSVWRAWTAGESGFRALEPSDSRLAPGIDPSALPDVERAAFVRDFAPRDHIRQGLLRRMDWVSRMLVSSARQAHRDAGLDELEGEALERAAVVVGSTFGNQRETARYTRRVLDEGLGAGSPLLFPNLVLNAPAGYAAIELGFAGPNLTVSEHEASGEAALAAAVDLLRSNRCDVVVVGGVDEFGEIYLQALAERRLLHPAVGWSNPASRRSSGWLIPAEAGMALVLEGSERARRRNAHVYGVVEAALTVGSRAGAYDLPPPAAAAQALTEAVLPHGRVDGFIGLADGGEPRREIDRACLAALADRQGAPVQYATFREQSGESGSIGLLGVALAALALDRASFPDRGGAATPVRRIALVGAARSGALAPICLASGDLPPGSPVR
jgi:3-oxoacyl-[acyl-carrier-protein] synthase II